jgi:hypothetical protein
MLYPKGSSAAWALMVSGPVVAMWVNIRYAVVPALSNLALIA